MGLNDPVLVRFVRYIVNAAHGDFGRSYKLNRDVLGLILECFPNTVKLAISSCLVAWIIGIPAGIISAVKRNSFLDRFLMGFALVGISAPVFWAAMLLQFIFGYRLGLLPISGYDTPQAMILPAIVLGWASSGAVARLVRSNLLEVIRNDYVRTARAKGLKYRAVIVNHADDSGVADKDAHKLRSEDVQQNRRYDHYENAFYYAFVSISQSQFFVL